MGSERRKEKNAKDNEDANENDGVRNSGRIRAHLGGPTRP
jgi:hypothetical protein